MGERTVLVTGASSGLGLRMAVRLAQRGYRVAATMRDPGRRGALDEAMSAQGVSAEVYALDVTDPASIARAVERVQSSGGTLYGLVNNAGMQVRGFFEDMPMTDVRRQFEVNVFGTMAVTRAVLPILREAGSGRILMVTSVAAYIGSPGLSAYTATKFALEGFGEALAMEVRALGIRVGSVAPPVVDTPIWHGNRHQSGAAAAGESPYAERFARVERLADRMVGEATVTADDVAGAVVRFMDAKAPPVKQVVGWKVAAILAARRLVPERIFDRLYAQSLDRLLSREGGSTQGVS